MNAEELSDAVYEDLNGFIVEVSTNHSEFRAYFECDDWEKAVRRRRFKLIFEDVREATLVPGECGCFRIIADHPLLWEHNEERVSMYFCSVASQPYSLLGQICETHAALLSGWRKLSDYWRADSRLLQTGYGLLAQGPRRVIDEYARIVDDKLRFSIVPDNCIYGEYCLVLFDNGFVICRNVSVVEVDLDR